MDAARAARSTRPAALLLAGALVGCALPQGSPNPDARPHGRFFDPALACDAAGNVYAVCTQSFDSLTQISLAVSRDLGDSWGGFQPLSHARNGDRRRPLLATGAPGELYVLWQDSGRGPQDLRFNRSLDGGATWMASDVRVNTNDPAGSHLSAADLACDDRGNVYAIWHDVREGFEAFYCNHSGDGGATWLAADVRVTALSLGRKSVPHLVCDALGNVYVSWIEQRGATPAVFFNTSGDRGHTWRIEDVQLASGGAALATTLCALEPDVVVVTWLESLRGSADIWFDRSTDRGRTWADSPRRLAVSVQPLRDPSAPQIATDATQHVYIAWHASTNDGTSRIVLESSEDAAQSFSETVIDRPYAVGDAGLLGLLHAPVRRPFIMTADRSGNVYFSWIERSAARAQVRFDRVSSYGHSWLRLGNDLGLSGPGSTTSAAPALCADDLGHVYLLWNEGDALHLASSSFYGDSGWRHRVF